MIVILDTAAGEAHNFRTRKEASEFIGVSLPTLRAWLSEPFFLHKTLIITNTSHEKVQKSNRALLKKAIRNYREIEIHNERMEASQQVQRIKSEPGIIPIDNTRSGESSGLAKVSAQAPGDTFVNRNTTFIQ